ncbi:MAG: exodeoxyribonuclease VII small subunit [Eggerthellaceae bacterium]|nr:exodeoxyribonuclease VII small subunit [Eggerthellaceae bacterium]
MARSIEDINARLKEILALVDDPDLPMDDILGLYEEAVKLGSEVSEAVEENIAVADALAAAETAIAPADAADASGEARE